MRPSSVSRKQKYGIAAFTDKAPATTQLSVPSNMPVSAQQPWMTRLNVIVRPAPITTPPPPPPLLMQPIQTTPQPQTLITPMPLTPDLQRRNPTLRSTNDDIINTNPFGTPPKPLTYNKGSMAILKIYQGPGFVWLQSQNPDWTAKKVLMSRASTAFFDKQVWLWDRIDEGKCTKAKKQRYLEEAVWAHAEMERRRKEFWLEMGVVKEGEGGVVKEDHGDAEHDDEKGCR